jgi:C1A family cysteine protease
MISQSSHFLLFLSSNAGVVSAVKDQGHCGSCWAFASTATVESYVAIATGLLFDLSTQQVRPSRPPSSERNRYLEFMSVPHSLMVGSVQYPLCACV